MPEKERTYDRYLRRIAMTVIGCLVLVTIVSLLVFGARSKQPAPKPSNFTQAEAIVLEGPLRVVSADTFSIGNRQFHLCGITQLNPANRQTTMSVLQTTYTGREFRCTQSGGGTPCDGQTSPTREKKPLMQCVDADGADLGVTLVESGLFCGTIDAPRYRRC